MKKLTAMLVFSGMLVLCLAFVGCASNGVAGHYEVSDGSLTLDLKADGSFVLKPSNYEERSGSYTASSDGTIKFEAAAVGRCPAEVLTGSFEGDKLTLDADSITFSGGGMTSLLSGWHTELRKK